MNKIKLHVKMLTALFHMGLLILVSIFLKPFFFFKKKKIWFFIDRPFGIDNAYWMYTYCKDHGSSDIEYIYICKNDKDQQYKNLEDDDGVVFEFSFRHFRYFIHADMYIYAYDTAPFYFNSFGKYFKKILKPNTPIFFLSHGVSRGQLDTIMFNNTLFDAYCSVGDREKKILEEEMKQKNVIITGYPRFDILHQNLFQTNEIVFLPARRLDLSFGTQVAFQESQYFLRIQSFLSSPVLHELLEKHSMKLIWHPHQYIKEFIELFDVEHPLILINTGDAQVSISSLFQKMCLCITDNSGAQFDAAYMKKPIIHYDFYPYHIDDQRLYAGEIGLFGNIYTKESDIIKKIESYLVNGCMMEQKYQTKVDDFFTYIDDKNCERVYYKLTSL